MRITSKGFQFLLEDVNTQLWDLLLVYLEESQVSPHLAALVAVSLKTFGNVQDLVETIGFLFMLGSLELGRVRNTLLRLVKAGADFASPAGLHDRQPLADPARRLARSGRLRTRLLARRAFVSILATHLIRLTLSAERSRSATHPSSTRPASPPLSPPPLLHSSPRATRTKKRASSSSRPTTSSTRTPRIRFRSPSLGCLRTSRPALPTL